MAAGRSPCSHNGTQSRLATRLRSQEFGAEFVPKKFALRQLGRLQAPALHKPRVPTWFDFQEYVTQKLGYPFEDHELVSHGYKLHLHRLPRPGGAPVLLMHGLMDTSISWVLNDHDSPAAFLYNAGYDVWLGNIRGSVYSLEHTTYNAMHTDKDNRAYWDFTTSTMGREDVPQIVQYILQETGKNKLVYVGFCIGATMMYAALADTTGGPALHNSISLVVGLGPAVTTNGVSGGVAHFRSALGMLEILPPMDMFSADSPVLHKSLAQKQCPPEAKATCNQWLEFMGGAARLDDPKRLSWMIQTYWPSSCSSRLFTHVVQQLTHHDSFREYDYGPAANLWKYGKVYAPRVDLKRINVPLAFFFGEKDRIGGGAENSAATLKSFNSKTIVFSKMYQNYGHFTWNLIDRNKSMEFWGDDLLKIMRRSAIRVA